MQKIKLFNKCFYIVFLCFIASVFSCLFIFSNNTQSSETISLEINNTANIGDAETLPNAYCLRDDNIIYTQDQNNNGLCWAFTATMSMSTTIAKATGEYYDFSENWISIYRAKETSSYKPGDGGIMAYVQNIPMVLESDCHYSNSNLIDKEHIDSHYNFYSQYSNNNFWDMLSVTNMGYGSNYTIDTLDSIKSAVYNNGSIYLGCRVSPLAFVNGTVTNTGGASKQIKVKEPFVTASYSTSDYSGHGVSIIGWDDDIQITTTYGPSNTTYTGTGAFIVLNSWGDFVNEDGIIYILYDDFVHGENYLSSEITDIYSLKYQPKTTGDMYFYDTITSGYTYTTNLCGLYYNNFTGTNNATDIKNIFYDDDVNLQYHYTISENTTLDNIKIYYNGTDVTNGFTININRTGQTFGISKNNLSLGNYKIIVTYSKGENSEEFINNFFVCNGTEICSSFITVNDAQSENGYYASFNTINLPDDYTYTKIKGTSITINFSLSPYSNINKIELYADNSLNTQFTTVGYYYDYSVATLYNLSSYSLLEIRITTNDSKTRSLFIKLLDKTSDYNTSTYVFYDLNGGINNSENYERMLVGSSNSYPTIIKAPTHTNLTFAGWYYNSNYTTALSVSGNNYYIYNSTYIHLGNNPTLYAISQYSTYYNNSLIAYIYAKWQVKVSFANCSTTAQYLEIGGTATQPSDPTKLGCTFVGWYADSSYTIPFDFTKTLYENTTIYAKWSNEINITANVANGHGSISPNGTAVVEYGNNLVYAITPEIGYKVSAILIDGVSVTNSILETAQSSNQFTLTSIIVEHTVTFYFALNSYNLIFDYNDGTYNQKSYPVSYTQSISSYPNLENPIRTGYTFHGWYAEESCTNMYTFNTMPAQDVTIYAKWELNKYSITINSGDYGTTKKDGVELNKISTSSISYIDNSTYSFIPYTGYHLYSVTINGIEQNEEIVKDIAENGLQFYHTLKAYTISVAYTKNLYQATIQIGQEYSSVSYPNDSRGIEYGDDCVLTFSTKFGYKITKIYINDEEVEIANNKVVIENVTDNLSITVKTEHNLIPIMLIALGLLAVTVVIIVVLLNKQNKKNHIIQQRIMTQVRNKNRF